ncbi:hypothetical protein [Streptomyces brasiliensis]|uniref:Uncharacterized protein n=1 Tax=Streptomyces brasiliensis TaxID=1954 RepID=A0A917P1F9_9ACTN|nr:hypothetical protein [Streptomyces brasiliensis]GGJ52300.1 hypothetical protein GCM10010121_073930 [Streptomyces brasiliensis]
MTDDLSNLGLECSPDWVPLPVTDTVDLDYWARYQAAELVERYARDGEKGDAGQLERSLRSAVTDSRKRTPLAAFALYLSGQAFMAAGLELDALHPDAEYPEVTLALLTEHMSVTDFGEPNVRRVRLPLGEAVRIRQNLIGEKKRWFGARPVIRSLFYGVRPEGMGTAVTLTLSWEEAVLDEPVEQMGDAIARTLTV